MSTGMLCSGKNGGYVWVISIHGNSREVPLRFTEPTPAWSFTSVSSEKLLSIRAEQRTKPVWDWAQLWAWRADLFHLAVVKVLLCCSLKGVKRALRCKCITFLFHPWKLSPCLEGNCEVVCLGEGKSFHPPFRSYGQHAGCFQKPSSSNWKSKWEGNSLTIHPFA